MSTNPPPPPFRAAAASPPMAPPLDRRAMKVQRRAIAEQAKRQRYASRASLRTSRRRSVVGPLLLLMLGVVLLLNQAGWLYWQSTLAWVGRWWPAVLILAGCVMVLEWALDRRVAEGHFRPRRVLGGGTVMLLILLGAAGAGIKTVSNSPLWLRSDIQEKLQENGFGSFRQLFGGKSEFSDELHAPLDDAGHLIVTIPRGAVTITGSSADGQVHVSVRQHIFAWQSSDVEERRRMEKVQLRGQRTTLTLTAPSVGKDDADVTIEVPHNAAVTVKSEHGDVTLEELRGNVEIVAGGGDVKLTALTGPVHLEAHNDNATITAHSLGKGLTLDGRAGDIELSDVDGPVALHGDFFGTTHLERVHGTVHFQSSFTDFACAGIPGAVNVEGRSDFDGEHLLGPVTITTTNRNLTLKGVHGAVSIHDRNGSVNLSLDGPLQPLRIDNENGSVELSLAAGQAFSLQARTQNGNIKNGFGWNSEKSGEVDRLIAHTGDGGPLFIVETTQGDLTINKGSAGDAAVRADTQSN